MRRLTKASLATGAAALLLLGGAQTLAFWTAEGSATGTEVGSGTLEMTDGTCTDWLYENGDAVVEGIVPGDTISTTCTLTVGGTGDNLALGEITVSDPVWAVDNDLTDALDVTLAGATLDGAELTLPLAEPVPVSLSDDLVVTVDAVFDTAAGNETQDAVAALDDITVQVTQAQPVP